jgi:hypothetical protein
MTRYLISFPDGAMDDIPDEDGPDVARAAHAVVREFGPDPELDAMLRQVASRR